MIQAAPHSNSNTTNVPLGEQSLASRQERAARQTGELGGGLGGRDWSFDSYFPCEGYSRGLIMEADTALGGEISLPLFLRMQRFFAGNFVQVPLAKVTLLGLEEHNSNQ